MHQSGIENCVASSGNIPHGRPDQADQTVYLNVTILYDGDPAGIKASLRGIDMLLEQGLHVRVVLLPEGEDPDSFARSHSSTEVLILLNTRESDFINFKARLLMQDAGSDPVRRANLIQEVVRSVSMVPDRIERTVYLQECSKLLGVEEQVLFTEAARLRRRLWEQKRSGRDYQNSEARTLAPRQQAQPLQDLNPLKLKSGKLSD
jgi:DNA primase